MVFPEPNPDAPDEATSTIGLMSLFGDPAGSVPLATRLPDARNVVFDTAGERLVALDATNRDLLSIPASAAGQIDPRPEHVAQFDLRGLQLGPLAGSATDPVDGALYVLDIGKTRIVRIAADTDELGRTTPALRDGGVCVLPLGAIPDARLRGLAVDPATNDLFLIGAESRRLFELNEDGDLRAIYDLSPLGIGDPVSMVFGPSGDPTEADTITSLYLLDHFERVDNRAARDRIVEIRLHEPEIPPGPALASDVHAVLVETIQTSAWTPTSSDPSGMAYLPGAGILASDAEIDETDRFAGVNVYGATPAGTLSRTYLTSFTTEPAGVAVDPEIGRWFISDDTGRRVFVLDPGADGLSGTGDDDLSSFDTSLFGSYDPEGLAFGRGTLFISDGLGAEIYRLLPGPNGVFDGAAPDGDDEISQFDTRALGQPTPEGLEYAEDRGTLFVVSNDRRSNLLEVTPEGRPVRVIDLSFLNAIAPAGLAYGPGSSPGGPSSLYIADRGVDNSRDVGENDGQIYEVRIVRGGPPNLVANPGMEVDEDANGIADIWSDDPGGSRSQDTARSGENSMRLEGLPDGVVVDQQLPSIDPERTYTIAFWVNVPRTDRPFTLRARIRWRDAAGTSVGFQKITTVEASTAGWEKLLSTIRSPARASSANIAFALEGEGAVVYIDDVLLIPAG
jgi:DNA-binding beta-propeller fold protein YncE